MSVKTSSYIDSFIIIYLFLAFVFQVYFVLFGYCNPHLSFLFALNLFPSPHFESVCCLS